MNWRKRFFGMKKIFLLTLLFLINTSFLFAQVGDDVPNCEGSEDPDTPCPLDTWVIVFAVIALIITTLYLYKKQESTKNLANN